METCANDGIKNFTSVKSFLESERKRIFEEAIIINKFTTMEQHIELKRAISKKPYVIAIDAYLNAIRYKRVFKRIEYGFFRQIMLCLSSGIIPVYVIDGKAPKQKQNIVIQRNKKKDNAKAKLEKILDLNINNLDQCISNLSLDEIVSHINNIDPIQNEWKRHKSDILLYNPSNSSSKYNELVKLSKKSTGLDPKDITDLIIFLDLLKVPHLRAPYEADDLMANLYKNGLVNACQSDDMDMLPKGCGNVIQITKNGVVQFLLPKILNNLGLTINQFVDFCILLGCDYYRKYLPKLSAIELYNIFKSDKCLSINNFVEIYSMVDPNIKDHLKFYEQCRKFFLETPDNLGKICIKYNLIPFNMTLIDNFLKKINVNINCVNNIQLVYQANKFIVFINSHYGTNMQFNI